MTYIPTWIVYLQLKIQGVPINVYAQCAYLMAIWDKRVAVVKTWNCSYLGSRVNKLWTANYSINKNYYGEGTPGAYVLKNTFLKSIDKSINQEFLERVTRR